MRKIYIPAPIAKTIHEVAEGETIGLLNEAQIEALMQCGAKIALAHVAAGVQFRVTAKVGPLYKWMEK